MKKAVSKNTPKKASRINERNKTLIKFLILIIISGLFGGSLSLAIGRTEADLASFGSILEDIFTQSSFFLLPLVGFLLLLISFICYKRQRKQVAALTSDDSDYDILNKINHRLDRALCMISLNTVFSSILYGLSVINLREDFSPARTLVLCVCYLTAILGGVFLQRKVIDLQKEMNPEKKGDVLSTHFQKDWIASCDELEKMIIYKAAYKSYIAIQHTIAILFSIVVLIGIWYPTGILPLLVTGALWIVSTVTYTMESMRLSYKGKKENTETN